MQPHNITCNVLYNKYLVYEGMQLILMRKKSKEVEQTLAELALAHHHFQAKCYREQTSYSKQIQILQIAVYLKTFSFPYFDHKVKQLPTVNWKESQECNL